METVEKQLRALAAKRPAIVCVGNPMRGDDGFGPAVAARLEGDAVFDAGAVPEDVLPKVERLGPDVVIFVDAAEFRGAPGELRLFSTEELAGGDVSTHAAPLSVAAEYLFQACAARSVLLAAQPKGTEFGSVMSVEVARAVEEAARVLRGAL